MGNGNTITITVTAQTAQAAAALQQFAQQSSGALNVISQGGKQVADEADKAATHVRGMAYGFRSAIDGLRFALAGGGERALFYTADEGVRSLLANGMKLSELAPILGGIGAAVGLVAIGIHEWNAGTNEAIKQAKDLADAWKGLPDLVKQVLDMQRDGLMGPGAAANYISYLTGHKKLYVDEHGNVTTSPTRTVQEPELTSGEFGMPISTGQTRPLTSNNPEASQDQVQKYFMDQSTANGQVTKEQLQSLTNLRAEVQKFNDEMLSGLEKQKAEVHARYQEERDEIEQNLTLAKATLGAVSFANNPEVQAGQKALAESRKAEAQEMQALEDDAADKAAKKNQEVLDRLAKGRQADLRQLDEAERKQAEADKQHEEALKKQQELAHEVAGGKIEAQLKGVEGNPFLTDQQKTQQSIPLYQSLMGNNWATIASLSRTAATSNNDSAALEAKEKILRLMQQQEDLQQKINQAEGQSSFTYQLRAMATQFQNIKTMAQDVTDIFSGGLTAGMNAVASNLTKAVMGTESWHRAVLDIEKAILGNIIEAIIKAAEQWVVSEVMKYTLGEVLKEAAVAGTAVVAAEEAAIWWTPAILSAIASAGVTADDASAQVGGAILGFAEGGRPEPGKVALVGERGPELWVPDSAGTVVPSDRTAAMMQGRGTAQGMVSSGNHNVNIHMWDHEPSAQEYLSSAQGQNHVKQIVRNSRISIGVQT